MARGVLIPKHNKQRYDEAKSYKTISLFNCLGKVGEGVVTELLSGHCEGNGTLRDGQFGARRKSAADTVGTLM